MDSVYCSTASGYFCALNSSFPRSLASSAFAGSRYAFTRASFNCLSAAFLRSSVSALRCSMSDLLYASIAASRSPFFASAFPLRVIARATAL